MYDLPCGNLSPYPDYPYCCTKPRGHVDDHGYAGVFWAAESKPWAHPDTMIGRT